MKVTKDLIIIDNAAHRPESVLEAADAWRRLFESLDTAGYAKPSTALLQKWRDYAKALRERGGGDVATPAPSNQPQT